MWDFTRGPCEALSPLDVVQTSKGLAEFSAQAFISFIDEIGTDELTARRRALWSSKWLGGSFFRRSVRDPLPAGRIVIIHCGGSEQLEVSTSILRLFSDDLPTRLAPILALLRNHERPMHREARQFYWFKVEAYPACGSKRFQHGRAR